MIEPVENIRTLGNLRQRIAEWRAAGKTIALVPTMGALHAGHVSLVKLAKKKAAKAVVSIFVNPRQFAPSEDLSRYPRDEAGDLEKLRAVDADLVWSPTVGEMYPHGFSTGVTPGSIAADLEGTFRPHHFAGVATVCCKLFNQVAPNIAVFGEKDYQQLMVLRQMIRELDMPLEIVSGPTQRELDGLALSSRNAYLSQAERQIAPMLYAVLSEAALEVASGMSAERAISDAAAKLLAAGFGSVDYVEVRDAETLAEASTIGDRPLRVLAAAWLGKTRLIDNVAV